MNKEIVRSIFPKEVKLVENKKCPFCRKEVRMGEFRDEFSARE